MFGPIITLTTFDILEYYFKKIVSCLCCCKCPCSCDCEDDDADL